MSLEIGGLASNSTQTELHNDDSAGPDPQLAARLGRITAPQRDCLRLVLEHKTSKEIALVLGISAHAVDKRLKVAAHILKVDGRLAAAKLVRDHEEVPSRYQRPVYRSPDLAEAHALSEVDSSNHGWSHFDEPPNRNDLCDVATDSWVVDRSDLGRADDGPQPRPRLLAVPWGAANTLRIGQRLILILLIAGFSAVAFGSVLASMDALRHLL